MKKMRIPIPMDLNNAMASALPKNGAVQGVAMIVVRMPLANMLLRFLDTNFGKGILIKSMFIEIIMINNKINSWIMSGDCS